MVAQPIRRQVTLDAPPEQVWEAVTTAEHLEAWFGAGVQLDARPGAPITVAWPDGSKSRGLVERVEPPYRFVFRWRSMSGVGLTLTVGAPTRVEFTLEPLDGGVERWIAYPVILWLVSFGCYLVGATRGLQARR